MFDLGFGFGFGFDFFSIFPMFIFLIILITLILNIFNGVRTWKHNNDSPRLKVQCKIVDKRQDFNRRTRHNHSNNTMSHSSVRTTYFVTFEVESGDRIELMVPNNEYGLLVEGDTGTLEFQGTRYLGFQRQR